MNARRGGRIVRVVAVLVAAGLASAGTSCGGNPVPTAVTAVQAKALIDATADLGIIDVSGAFAAGHLPGAVSLPLADGSLAAALPTLDRTRPWLVYCHSDASGRTGAQMLLDEGMDDVFWLQGSYAAWVGAGYSVETGL
jgi:rhodanese-related sulfurtransferase